MAEHLLRRSGFAPLDDEVDRACARDLPELVAGLFDRSQERPAVMPAEMLAPGQSAWNRWAYAVQDWLERMATSPVPLVEKMALFWHGHFVSALDKVGSLDAMWRQVDTYRRLGLGNLRTLAQAMAIEPAMLRYLDNDVSTAGAPNLNFARELFELFLLGVGHYTEHDIAECARAWTGHTIDPATGAYTFDPARHDAGLKTIFGVTQAFDGPDVIDLVFTLPETRRTCARFVAGKLWAHLASPHTTADAIDELTTTFLAHDFALQPLLQAIFHQPSFHDPATRDGLVRSPIEWCVALRRSTGVPFAETHPEWWLPAMGQTPFNPPNVAGWKTNEYWLSTTASAARADYAAHVAWKARGAGVLAETTALTSADAVDAALQRFGVRDASTVTRHAIDSWLLAQRAVPWTDGAQVQGLMVLAALAPEMQLA